MLDALKIDTQTPGQSAGGWTVTDAEGVAVLVIPETVAQTRHDAERVLDWIAPLLAKVSDHAERYGWRIGREALSRDLRRLIGAEQETQR